MLCPACEGEGCNECKDGQVDVTQCPLEIITADIWQAINLSELYEKGLPPIAGGALDQAQIFLETAMFVMGEINYWKKKLRISD